MKLDKSLEQATCVITMLALQEGHKPVKSHVLSEILQVSDSYLKKILMKLSKANLVVSNASKTGGYLLARPVEEITLKDVLFALEINADVVELKHVAHQIYDDKQHVEEVERKIKAVIEEGFADFYTKLESLKISDLLHTESYENGAIDWNERIGK